MFLLSTFFDTTSFIISSRIEILPIFYILSPAILSMTYCSSFVNNGVTKILLLSKDKRIA
jgi:hypothetical protein